jgi:tight adherence protein B
MTFIAIGLFVCVFAFILAAYWLLVVTKEEKEARAVRRRLTSTRSTPIVSTLTKAREELSRIGAIDAFLTRYGSGVQPVREWLAQSGLRLTLGALLLLSIFLGLVAVVVMVQFTGSFLACIAAAIAAAVVPTLYVRRAAIKRVEKFEEQFPDVVDLMARALRAGHALPTALQLAGEESPDAGFFVTAVLTQREMGGNLAEVLDNLASVIRERFKVKRQVRVISAHGRITGVVLGFLPPAVAGVLFLISPAHIRVLVEDPIGVYLVAAGITLQIIGVMWIRQVVNVEY